MNRKNFDFSNYIYCVIPVYNNALTIKRIVTECIKYIPNVLVVDDGSTDLDVAKYLADLNVEVIAHATNKGKGAALMSAMRYLLDKNVSHMITIDGDGQHLPQNIPYFIEAIQKDPDAIYVGTRDFSKANIPGKSRFGRKFSNMWFKLETGKECSDTQSGFRAYPVKLISKLKMTGSKYDFEVEVLARSSWAGIEIKDIYIDVFYPNVEDRISHFKPIKDNFRISLMHTRLIGRRLMPIPFRKLVDKKKQNPSFVRHPIAFIKKLLTENTTPLELAISAGVGTILAVLPFIGVHSILIIYFTARLHLNKIMALAIQNLYAPPFVPFICIEFSYFLRNGHFIKDFSLEMFKNNWQMFFLDWVIGSILLAPVYAVIAFICVFFVAKKIQRVN